MSDESPATEPAPPLPPPILFAEFLEGVPPASARAISDLRERSDIWYLRTPDVQLHCDSESCGGIRFFRYIGGPIVFAAPETQNVFLNYVCRNCEIKAKIYAVFVKRDKSGESGHALKYGEWPVFGAPTPPRLVSLVGANRDAFLKGRRSENQGLGIGAFAYYRRVVENLKDHLLDEIIKVAQMTGAKPNTLTILQNAKKETQFSKAIDMVKDAIPDPLKIKGHNPLTLLHPALSEGIHGKTDEECLELAKSIRVVLTELAERTGTVLKDQAELSTAVSRLLAKNKDATDGIEESRE